MPPTRDEVGLTDEVIATIPLYPGQELHLRRRTLERPNLPVFFDWAQYDVATDRYYLATPFKADQTVIDGMIEALQTARTTL